MARFRRLSVLLLCAWPLLARADDVKVAHQRFKEGVEYFDKGEYDKARAAFLQAYALKKHPAVLLNLAQSCLRAHREAEAARHFKQYLAEGKGTPSEMDIARRGLADARARDGRIEIRAPNGAEVLVDDQSVGVAPIELYDIEPGKHVVRVKDGASQTVTVAAGAVVVADLGGPPPPAEQNTTSAAPTTPPPARPLSEMLGGPGESCRARSDCETSLACIDNTCVDPNAPRPPKPTPEHFELRGVHAFLGLAMHGGPAWLVTNSNGVTSNDPNLQGSFAFALRGGLFAGRSELAIEISPMTDIVYRNVPPAFTGPAFGATFSYAYYAPLHEGPNVSVYWPIRIGAGVLAGGDNTYGLAYVQGRLDLVGFAVRVGHVMIGVELPSFRYAFTTTQGALQSTLHLFAWRPGATFSYVF
jgi:hypothetical protein